ncbi:MAG: hypothetical protein JSU95_17030 [Betaproteobacteria bacterium]|nr:MAG: hypothetical protein JSU95_17030 [Betaproteobacteria bacterium]
MTFENTQAIRFRSLSSKVLASALVTFALTATPVTSWSQDETQVVKMSQSGVCHDTSSRHYARVKNFKPYDSIRACLDDGGRTPKK